MAAIFCAPLAYTVSGSSEIASAKAVNLTVDHPGLVWRSNGLSGVYVTVALAGATIDTVALVGSNLRATDTVRVRGSNNADLSSPLFDTTINSWSGIKGERGAITVLAMATTYAPAYVRIDITSTGNPAGYVEAQRLILGKRIEVGGVDLGADHSVMDTSSKEDVLGYTAYDDYRARDSWKITVSNVAETAYWGTWYPFIRNVKTIGGFLFIPDTDPAFLQNQAMLARMMTDAKGNYRSGELLLLDFSLLQV